MKVIFLHDVPRIGKKYDVKEINSGYAMNFLIPRKLAELATPSAILKLEQTKNNIKIEREMRDDLLMKHLLEIKGKVITIKGKANEKGSLFSSIHKKEIIEAMKEQHNASLDEEFVVLEKPIKTTGEFEIPVLIKGRKSSFILHLLPS